MNNTKRKSHHFRDRIFTLVEVTGFEPAASSSQNWRATNCATPRFRLQMSDIRRQTNVLAKPKDYISFHIFFSAMIMHFNLFLSVLVTLLRFPKDVFRLERGHLLTAALRFARLLLPPAAAVNLTQNRRVSSCATPRFRLQMSDIRRQTNVSAKPTDFILLSYFYCLIVGDKLCVVPFVFCQGDYDNTTKNGFFQGFFVFYKLF